MSSDKPESEETPMEQADDSSSKTVGSGDGDALKCQVPETPETSMESQPSESKSEQAQKSESESRTENHASQNVTTDTKMDTCTDDKGTALESNGGVVAGAGVQDSGGEAGDAKVDKGELIDLKVMYNKKKYDVSVGNESTVAELKTEIQTATGVPPEMQKLMFKGLMKDDKTLKDLNVTSGSKLMLIGSTPKAVLEVTKPVVAGSSTESEDKASTVKEPLSKQKMHKKVLDKGKPEDAMVGIKNRNDALPNVPVSGMLNKAGGKVRLTFKLEQDQLWIGTKERTEKIHMNSIKNVVSEPIEGHEDYHIMAIQLGPTEASRYWIYWVPAQYAKAIKDTILGKWVYF